MIAYRELLPEEPVGEFTICRPYTAPGLFCYRHQQALNLLDFPDFGGGNLDTTQRREALTRSVPMQRPLAALIIFLNVVALEDFIRDLGARLADNKNLSLIFPEISRLRMIPLKPKLPSARLDKDPITPLLDPAKVNGLYHQCLGIEPIPTSEYSKLLDLALLRHTVAHHGALIRSMDVQRFQYYVVQPGHLINPPIEFVRDICSYLYQTGRKYEDSVKYRIFSGLIPTLDKSWWEQPSPLLVELIETFNYFGKLEITNGPVGTIIPGAADERQMLEERSRIRDSLISQCIGDLRENFPNM